MIVGPEDARAALWEVFSRMIGAMLAHPEKIKVGEIERAMAYLEKMKPDPQMIADEEPSLPVTNHESPVTINDIEEAEVLFDIGIWGEAQAIEALQGFVAKQLRIMKEGKGEGKAGQVKAVKDAMELIETLQAKSRKQEAANETKKEASRTRRPKISARNCSGGKRHERPCPFIALSERVE